MKVAFKQSVTSFPPCFFYNFGLGSDCGAILDLEKIPLTPILLTFQPNLQRIKALSKLNREEGLQTRAVKD